jgi:hypothetical protein
MDNSTPEAIRQQLFEQLERTLGIRPSSQAIKTKKLNNIKVDFNFI